MTTVTPNWITNYSNLIFLENINSSANSSSSVAEASQTALETGFCWCVVFIGAVGLVSNALVIYALGEKKQRRRTANTLIINQSVIDFLACILLIVSYSLKLVLNASGEMMRRWGGVVCSLLVGDGLVYVASNAATTNLEMIAVERYFKIVHSIQHKNHFRQWMMYVAISIPYIQGILINVPAIWTSQIGPDGHCYQYVFWTDESSKMAYSWTSTILLYIWPVILFVFCYGRIVREIQKRSKIVPSNGVGETSQTGGANQNSNQSQTSKPEKEGINQSQTSKPEKERNNQSQTRKPKQVKESNNRQQTNVIKTMLIISISYALTKSFNSIGYVIYMYNSWNGVPYTTQLAIYSVGVGLVFINVCLDPIIYAASLDSVKPKVRKLFCKY